MFTPNRPASNTIDNVIFVNNILIYQVSKINQFLQLFIDIFNNSKQLEQIRMKIIKEFFTKFCD